MKRIYRSILHDLYPDEFPGPELSPEQTARQVQRGRDLARHKPWEAGRIGRIENRVHTELICARGAISTGQLVRKIYCHERYDQNFRLRDEGAGPPRSRQPRFGTWFFVTVDYAFGHAVERDTSDVVKAAGGKVLAHLMHAKHELKANFCETRSSVSARVSSAD